MHKYRDKLCELCNANFVTNNPDRRFCSQECINKYRNSQLTAWNENIGNGKRKSLKAMRQLRKLHKRPRTEKQIEASRANLIAGNKLPPTQKQREARRKNAIKLHKLPRTQKQLNNCKLMHSLPKTAKQLNQIRLLGLRYGKENNGWKGGITPLRKLIRSLKENEEWRLFIFTRDNYKCQDCGQRGGKLVAHHKREFNIIFREFLKKYCQYSPIDDKEALVRLAVEYKPFWDTNNGITKCKDCHKRLALKRPWNG